MNARLVFSVALAAFAVGIIVGRISGPETEPLLGPSEEPPDAIPHPAAVADKAPVSSDPAEQAESVPASAEDPAEALVRYIDRIVKEPPPPPDPIPELYLGSVIRTPHGDLKIVGSGKDYRLARHGRWTTFFPSGGKSAEEDYLDGVLQGPSVHWHEGGGVKERGSHRDGKRHGTWETFDEAGRRTAETEYEEGKILSLRRWGPDGAPLTDDSLEVRATCKGKYRGLLHRFHVPDDAGNYGEFRDYGHYRRTDYQNVKNVPAAYWVYVYPYWYVWREKAE